MNNFTAIVKRREIVKNRQYQISDAVGKIFVLHFNELPCVRQQIWENLYFKALL